LYDAINATFQVLLRNKMAGLLLDDSNQNQIILITDEANVCLTQSWLTKACKDTKAIVKI
jgi:hypothetical protein